MGNFNNPFSSSSVNLATNLHKANQTGGKEAMNKVKKSHEADQSRLRYTDKTLTETQNENAQKVGSGALAKGIGNTLKNAVNNAANGTSSTESSSATPLFNDEELKKLLGILPDEAEKKLDKFEKSAGRSIKTAYYGYDKNITNPDGRTARAYRSQLNSLIEKYATPHDMYGIGGMPAIFLDNTDPPGKPNSNIVGRNYLINNVLNGTYVAFKPGYIEWAFTDDDAAAMEGGQKPMGVVGKMFTGTLAHNRK